MSESKLGDPPSNRNPVRLDGVSASCSRVADSQSSTSQAPGPKKSDSQISSDDLPFLAPCKKLSPTAPIKWITLGWRDICRAPLPSLSYGLVLVLCSYLITYIALSFGNVFSVIALASGFIFLGPLIAMGFYEISRQLQLGRKPRLIQSLQVSSSHVGDQLIFALILLVIFLIWARAASMLHIFFPVNAQASFSAFFLFLVIGSLVGSLFALLVFCISAFSLPMIAAKNTDSITAVVTSFNAVLRNKLAMCVWALLIVTAVGFGLLTGFIGFAISLPLIGHATWHAYQATINADAWPSKHQRSS